MIVVTLSVDGLCILGHAEYAEKGKDIICAGVSTLAHGLIKSLDALTNDKIRYQMAPGSIDIEYENLSEQGKLLIDSFFIAVSEIQYAYGSEYVTVITAPTGGKRNN